MFENFKNAIREYESESVRKFADALGKMAVAACPALTVFFPPAAMSGGRREAGSGLTAIY